MNISSFASYMAQGEVRRRVIKRPLPNPLLEREEV